MRTKQINIYKYDELSDRAKQNALYRWASHGDYDGSENEETLKAFENIFPVNVRDWEYGERGREYVRWTFTADDDIENLSGVRLLTYLANNYFRDLWKGKYYSTRMKWIDGKCHYKSRHSKVIFDNACVLTDVWIDHDILQPIYGFMKKPDHRTFRDLMEECLESWISACTNDYEHYYSKEHFAEMCEGNEWEFDEYGNFA